MVETQAKKTLAANKTAATLKAINSAPPAKEYRMPKTLATSKVKTPLPKARSIPPETAATDKKNANAVNSKNTPAPPKKMKTSLKSGKGSPSKSFKFDAAIQEDKTQLFREEATPADTISIPKSLVSQSLLLDKIERDLGKDPI